MKLKLQQLKNDLHIKLTNQQLTTVGGVLCIGALAYAAYKYLAPEIKGKTSSPAVTEQKSFQQIYREVIMNVQQCISKHQTLNGQVIKCILKNQYKLAEYEYKAFIFKVRNQRRKVIKDKHQYRRVIMTMDAANEELMDKNLNAILAHFNIEKTNWIETVDLWSNDTEQNKQEWENLLINLENDLLDSLRDNSKHPLPFKKLNDIINFKIHTLQNLNESGLDLDSSITSDQEPDLNAKHALIEKYIQDLVFTKFGVEEEDILYSQNQLSQEDKDKIFTIDDQFMQMMKVAIYGQDEQEGEGEDNEQEAQQQEFSNEEGGDDVPNGGQDVQQQEGQINFEGFGDGESTENSVSKQKQQNAAQQKHEQEKDDESQYY